MSELTHSQHSFKIVSIHWHMEDELFNKLAIINEVQAMIIQVAEILKKDTTEKNSIRGD